MTEKSKKSIIITICIILGIMFAYSMQMSPSPILLEIRDYYGIVNNDMLLNMVISVIYITIVIGCFTGATIEQKIGTPRLFIFSMLLVAAGGLLSLVASKYAILLFARAVFGLGFGLSVQFVGSAIMKYYQSLAREKMNTLNGMFPFIGTLFSFFLASPLSKWLGGFKGSLAFWSIPVILAIVIWLVCIKEKELPDYSILDAEDEPTPEGNIYKSLWKRKEIRLLSITYICDFACVSYICVIIPTLFYEATSMSIDAAGLVAAIAFPAFGILGTVIGGIMVNKTGMRRPSLLLGQILKFVGVCISTLGCNISPILLVAGVCIFGIGNGMWMPSLYCVPMDLEGMTSTLAGASFSLMTAFGMVAGFLAPTIGGWLTNILMDASKIADSTAAHAYGLQWSLFIFGFTNIISSICMFIFKETGKKRN